MQDCIITKPMAIDRVTNESILDQYGGVRIHSDILFPTIKLSVPSKTVTRHCSKR